MNVIDLFAGAGGLSEGFRRQGFNIIAHVEMDKDACLTLKTREAFWYLKEKKQLSLYKDYLNKKISRENLYENIPSAVLDRVINSEISEKTLPLITNLIKKNSNEEVDIIIGGPPCQAYSIAGRSRDANRMKNDSRNYLYKQYISFLKAFNPKIFIFENVEGILSAQNGEIFTDIKKCMKEAGYSIDYRLLNSKNFGVLQSRKRIIIIGWRKDIEFSYPQFNTIKSNFSINDLFSDLPKISSGQESNKYIETSNGCLKKLAIKNDDWDILTQHKARSINDNNKKIYELYLRTWNNEKRKLKYNELPAEFINHKNLESFLDRFNIVASESISHTVVAHICKDGNYYIHSDINQLRSITIREAARIQSFPDDYFFEKNQTSAFRQIGNAVPPLMAEEIAKEIKKFLADNYSR